MKRRRSKKPHATRHAVPRERRAATSSLRIVGGEFRGRRLGYTGDVRVRPMKDRTREAVFNLLGPEVKGMHVFDLFAGTGAMGLEALSRGAEQATLIERHLPTAAAIDRNVAALGVKDRANVVRADAFHWGSQLRRPVSAVAMDQPPWLVFCCPPYAFFRERLDRLRELLGSLRHAAPAGSIFVVEAAMPFDFTTLWPGDWTTRDYSPAAVGIFHVTAR